MIALRLDTYEQARADRLIAILPAIPKFIRLTPTYRKMPVLPNWAAGMERSEIATALQQGYPVERGGQIRRQYLNGFAALTGDGLIALDFDGKSALYAGRELAIDNGGMPPTPMWKGAKGQSALYLLPDELSDRAAKLEKQVHKIAVKEGCVAGEAIEIHYSGSRVTLPPSAHPDTPSGSYEWLERDGQALDFSVAIAPAPKWVCDVFEAELTKQEYWQSQPKQQFSGEVSEVQARLWLEAIDVDSLDYDEWFKVGSAIKSAFPDLNGLELWDSWSQLGSSYKPGDCDRRWDFTPRTPIAYLARLAGFELTAIGAGVGFAKPAPEQTEAQKQRDRLIAKRMLVYLSNFKPIVDKSLYLGDTPADKTTWYQGYKLGDPLVPRLCADSIFIRGGLGSGKTEAMLREVATGCGSKQSVWITLRLDTMTQTVARAEALGIPCYIFQQDVGLYRQMLRSGQPGLYFFCLEGLSAYHTEHIDWSRVTLIVDEFSSLRADAPGGSAEIFQEFQHCITEAGRFVAIDANLSDLDAHHISALRPGKSQHFYRQVEVKSPDKINWVECRNKSGEISLSHDGVAYRWIERRLKAGDRYSIASDTKTGLKAAALHTQSLGSRIDLATSETIEFCAKFAPNPDASLTANSSANLGYSPKIQNGADIQTRFDRQLVLASGVLRPDQILQTMKRVRNVGEIDFSAPRRSLNQTTSFNALTPKKVGQLVEKLTRSMLELNSEASVIGAVWGATQKLLDEVFTCYNSEALRCLLEEKFEIVETIELEADSQKHQEYCKAVKLDEAKKTCEADAAHGRELLDKKRAPRLDSEYWDIEAAKLADRYPSIWSRIQQQQPGDEQAIAIVKELRSSRTSKLRNYVAAEELPEQELELLLARMRKRSPNPNSPTFKRYQNLRLYRELNLKELACAGGSAVADETHFTAQSPKVVSLYEQFRASKSLMKLFPQVETVQDFWAIVRRCMSAMGLESAGKTIRVESDVPTPNGTDRHGKQRYVKSRSAYFSGWKPIEESGSELFRHLLPEIKLDFSARILEEYSKLDLAEEIPEAA